PGAGSGDPAPTPCSVFFRIPLRPPLTRVSLLKDEKVGGQARPSRPRRRRRLTERPLLCPPEPCLLPPAAHGGRLQPGGSRDARCPHAPLPVRLRRRRLALVPRPAGARRRQPPQQRQGRSGRFRTPRHGPVRPRRLQLRLVPRLLPGPRRLPPLPVR